MKRTLRRFALAALLLWLYMGLCPPAVHLLLSKETSNPAAEASGATSPVPETTAAPEFSGTFRIYDQTAKAVLQVSEQDFLPLALLCEMPPDAPAEALKAQAVAIRTQYRYLSLHNSRTEYDFTCNTAQKLVYAPASAFETVYGADWPSIFAYIQILCGETEDLVLQYDGQLTPAPYFALSAGCTQPGTVLDATAALPYLQSAACPGDQLYDGFQVTVTHTPDEVRTAFPACAYPEDPADWFGEPKLYPTGYVASVTLCGEAFSGMDVMAALSLRSPAFSVAYDGTVFRFTTQGWGHGVGMSRAGAMDMAADGSDFRAILQHFYPGTTLEDGEIPLASGSDLR